MQKGQIEHGKMYRWSLTRWYLGSLVSRASYGQITRTKVSGVQESFRSREKENLVAKTIWKFPIKITDRQTVPMPRGAQILTAQVQHDEPYLWAIVSRDVDLASREIEIFGTGNPIYEDTGVERKYIATFQQGPFVWHVFERTG